MNGNRKSHVEMEHGRKRYSFNVTINRNQLRSKIQWKKQSKKHFRMHEVLNLGEKLINTLNRVRNAESCRLDMIP